MLRYKCDIFRGSYVTTTLGRGVGGLVLAAPAHPPGRHRRAVNSIDDFLEILVAVYVVVIALIVVLTRLESTLDNRSRPRPSVRRSKLASVDARD